MNVEFVAYYLAFSGPLHPGIESIGQERVEETIRSDTLWGAIVQSWMLLFDDSIDEIIRDMSFAVSSCFPIINGTRFFPLPVGVLDNLMEEVSQKSPDFKPSVKDLKKIKYISESLLIKIIQGNSISLKDITPDNKLLVYPCFYETHNTFVHIVQRPRIRINQLRGTVDEDAFFYCSDIFFPESSGLFFLATFENELTKQKFDAALGLLGDTGIGADRSIGRGQFRYTTSLFSVPLIQSDCSYLLLSLYQPSSEEVRNGIMSSDYSNYTLVRRWGRAGSVGASRFRRADTWMLSEGSILPFKPEGTIPKVLKRSDKVPHDVYRYGRAFALPIANKGILP